MTYLECLIEQWYKFLQIVGAITIGYVIGNQIALLLGKTLPTFPSSLVIVSFCATYLFLGAYMNFKIYNQVC